MIAIQLIFFGALLRLRRPVAGAQGARARPRSGTGSTWASPRSWRWPRAHRARGSPSPPDATSASTATRPPGSRSCSLIPIVLGATIFEAGKAVHEGLPQRLTGPMIVGAAGAAISGYLAIAWLLRLVAPQQLLGPSSFFRFFAGAAHPPHHRHRLAPTHFLVAPAHPGAPGWRTRSRQAGCGRGGAGVRK